MHDINYFKATVKIDYLSVLHSYLIIDKYKKLSQQFLKVLFIIVHKYQKNIS